MKSRAVIVDVLEVMRKTHGSVVSTQWLHATANVRRQMVRWPVESMRDSAMQHRQEQRVRQEQGGVHEVPAATHEEL